MDEKLFAKIIRDISPLTAEVCFHLMGEPLTHPKLARFLAICIEADVPVNITTNGLLLDSAKTDILLNPIVRQVNFSLHSFRSNFKDRDINVYLNSVFEFTKQALIKRPDLYINFRLWNLNESESESNEEIFLAIEHTYKIILNRSVHVELNKSKKIMGRLYLHFDSQFDWPSLQAPLQSTTGFCHGLGSHIGIHADGTVVPCCLDKEAGIPLGNCQNESVESIVNSKRAQQIREGFKKGQLVEDLCQRCQFIRRFDKKIKQSESQALTVG